MPPLSRIVADRRLLVTVLGLLALANLVGLVVVFGPLRSRVATLNSRAAAATLSATNAARELATARRTSTGSVQAAADLRRFYADILPANQPAARQLTLVRLAQLAREANLSYDARGFSRQEPDEDGVLTRAVSTMTVYGSYRDLRRFIHTLETGEDFVVISSLGVSVGGEANDPLEAALTLATYYKADDGR